MSTFKLITDSTADLPQEYLNRYDIGCIKLSYTLDGQTYGGTGKEMDWKEFYRLMREEGKLPTTSQINPEEFKSYFEEMLKEYSEILYLAFSVFGTLFDLYTSNPAEVREAHKACSGCP